MPLAAFLRIQARPQVEFFGFGAWRYPRMLPRPLRGYAAPIRRDVGKPSSEQRIAFAAWSGPIEMVATRGKTLCPSASTLCNVGSCSTRCPRPNTRQDRDQPQNVEYRSRDCEPEARIIAAGSLGHDMGRVAHIWRCNRLVTTGRRAWLLSKMKAATGGYRVRARQTAGAPGRNRTSTVLPPPDFEFGASTNSATGAGGRIIAATGRGSTPIAVFAPYQCRIRVATCAPEAPASKDRRTTHGRRHHQHDPLPAVGGGRGRDRGRAARRPSWAPGSSSTCSGSSRARSASSSATPIISRCRSRCWSCSATRSAPRARCCSRRSSRSRPACCGTPGSASIMRASSGSGGRVRRNARGTARASVRPAICSSSCRSFNVVRCDEAAWRFLGLSLAGYNALISLALAARRGVGIARRPQAAGAARAR